jgi:hypothetical protein
MIVAIVALVAALAGTAVAGGGFLTKKKFNKFKSTAVTRLTYVTASASIPSSTGAPANYEKVSANCPAGQHPVGGGAKGPDDDSVWWGSGFLTATGYTAYYYNGSSSNQQVTVTVACVSAAANGSPPA